MRLNPRAAVVWTLGGLVGWLINDTTGAVIGVASMMALSIIAETFL